MDFTLTEQLIAGDELAFKDIFYKNCPGLVKFAESYLHDKQLAENMAQDAFIILWEKRASLDIDSNIKAYLVTIIKNNCIKHIEKAKNRLRIENRVNELFVREADLNLRTLHSLNPEELFTDEIISIVEKAVQALPEQTREVFLLSRFQGFSNPEIAEKIGISVKGVEYHISRSLKIMKKELSDYLPLIALFL